MQAESEVLGRKMAALQGVIAEQAAEVHRSNKFNSGATEPSAGSSPTKLNSGLAGTAEVLPKLDSCPGKQPFPAFPWWQQRQKQWGQWSAIELSV